MTNAVTGNMAHFSYIDKLGLSPYSLLEGAWAFIGIVEGIRTEIWKGDVQHPIHKLWVSLELIDSEDKLTEAGTNIINSIDLFEYEFSMMQQQLVHDFKTEPEKYVKLRGALGRYSDTYLGELTKWMLDLIPENSSVLDFGGGNGHYLYKVLNGKAGTAGVLYDKAPPEFVLSKFSDRMVIIKDSFKDDTDFFQENQERFDTVVMSEVLHCISNDEWPKFISLLMGLLRKNGKLIILEQQHGFRLDWRLQSLSDGMSIPPQFLKTCLDSIARTQTGISVSEVTMAPTHYGVYLEKL